MANMLLQCQEGVFKKEENIQRLKEQAGAELGQAQPQLGLEDNI